MNEEEKEDEKISTIMLTYCQNYGAANIMSWH